MTILEGFSTLRLPTSGAELHVARRHDVHGRALPCGHFLAEEAPEECYAELRGFFRPAGIAA